LVGVGLLRADAGRDDLSEHVPFVQGTQRMDANSELTLVLVHSVRQWSRLRGHYGR